MNNYLLLLGSNVSEIRQILNLSQEELANKLGISRPTIVKLEQDPSRFTKTLALALFMVVSYEISKRIRNLSNINPKDYKDPENFDKLVKTLTLSSALSTGAITSAAVASLGRGMPKIGAIVAGISALYMLKSKKSKANESRETPTAENWNEEQGKKLITEIKNVLLADQNKLLKCFNLNSFSIEEFIKAIDTAEEQKGSE